MEILTVNLRNLVCDWSATTPEHPIKHAMYNMLYTNGDCIYSHIAIWEVEYVRVMGAVPSFCS